MKSLALDRGAWDLVLDLNGNIAVVEEPYRVAQDAACAVRLFLGELWFDTGKGVPYFDQVLGKFPPLQLVKSLIVDATLTVPGVATATVYISGIKGRVLTGQIQITTTQGVSVNVGF